MPPKIKTFWWRIAHNGIAVAENLVKRRIQIDTQRLLCGEKPENLYHLMFDCRVSREIWSLAPTNCSLSQQQTSTLLDRMKAMIKASKRDRKELLSFFVGWRIWKMRNRLLYENKREHIVHVVHSSISNFQLWQEANSSTEDMDTITNKQPSSLQEVIPEEAE